MNEKDIASIRLVSQQIAGSKFKTAKEIVGWMGAMQAQDYIMCKWAVGMRLPHSTEQNVEAAIDKGEVIRTHLLRPTWHLVSSDDIYWMLELTAPQIKQLVKSRDKQLELNEKIYKRSNKIFEDALKDGGSLIREDLKARVEKVKIATDENRMSHLLLRAELDGIICSGVSKNGKRTYALLEERVPKPKQLSKEEALAKLAHKYFTSHCPATLQDFIWWSGLQSKAAKESLEMIKGEFYSELIESQTYWFSNTVSMQQPEDKSVYLLPSYDEFIISYRDRSASLLLVNHKTAISSNGIFRPVILLNGKVIGLWNRLNKKNKLTIQTSLFKKQPKAVMSLIENAAKQYQDFLEKEIGLKQGFE